MMLNIFQKFIDDFFSFSNVSPIEFSDVIMVLFWSIIFSFLIANTYRATHRGVSYSQTFTQTLVLLGVIVSAVILIIGTDIARAFTLVGALSIIRFRNALKETRDIGFIFFIMVVGMGCGARFYLLTLILTLVGCSLVYFMTFTKFGEKNLSQDILEFNFPVSQDYIAILSPIFIKYLKYYSMLGIDSVDEKTNRISFIITFKKKSKISRKGKKFAQNNDKKGKMLFLADIQKVSSISNIKVIDGSSSVEI